MSAPTAAAAAASSSAATIELTLIVAATRSMGIGAAGGLPWTGLRREMAYFARVTKRLPVQAPADALNAVIMGRKTWDSIPPKFRPLKGRLNVVITRSAATAPATPVSPVGVSQQPQQQSPQTQTQTSEGPVRVPSLEAALDFLEASSKSAAAAAAAADGADGNNGAQKQHRPRPLGKVFVIGGAQIYAAALQLRAARRVLLTKLLEPEFPCDTFFPLRLDGAEGAEGAEEAGKEIGGDRGRWRRRGKGDLDAWVGEDVPGAEQEENGTKYGFQMWEREG